MRRSGGLLLLLLGCGTERGLPDASMPVPQHDAGAVSCDDGNACTVDRCDETGSASHEPMFCPAPADPCQVAQCDAVTGCGSAPLPDGTPCDPDRCSSVVLRTCQGGHCVIQPAPPQTRCPNQWESFHVTSRTGHALAYDSDRHRTVLFGGVDATRWLDDTWEWDGERWFPMSPQHHPFGGDGAAMIYDPVKKRTVAFQWGQTWEWDGQDWTLLSPAHQPSRRQSAGFVYDSTRKVGVLFGGDPHSYEAMYSDTWEWNGSDWAIHLTAHSPGPRSEMSIAYDPERQIVLVYGGVRVAQFAETWAFDGVDWSRVDRYGSSSSKGPMAYLPLLHQVVRFDAGLWKTLGWNGTAWVPIATAHLPDPDSTFWGQAVYDSARAELFVYGGSAQGWRFGGADWVLSEAVAMPAPRRGAAAAYDGIGHRVVMFGGNTFSLDETGAETWAWDGQHWRRLAPSDSPGPLVDHNLVRDSSRDVLVLFGGADPAGHMGTETWEWDGHAWHQRKSTHSPPARRAASMAYDSTRRRVVLFGGFDPPFQLLDDTWEWDGTDWEERSLPFSPSRRSGAAMVFDEPSQRVLLFGGLDETNASLGDTWTYDGEHWVPLTPSHAPSPRSSAAIGYDTLRSRVILYGGGRWEQSDNEDTWTWNGNDWVQLGPVGAPNVASSAAFAYDPKRDSFVMFGGTTNAWGNESQDTWLYFPP